MFYQNYAYIFAVTTIVFYGEYSFSPQESPNRLRLGGKG